MFTPAVLLLFAAIGSLAGFLAGLLGIGGGVILVPVLSWVFNRIGVDPTVQMHMAIGTSLAIIFPTTISSTLSHFRNGHVNPRKVLILSCGAMVGALCGSGLAAMVDGAVLKGMFGLMQFGVALKLLLPSKVLHMEPDHVVPAGPLLLVGFAAGAFSAFFGVGGGVIAVPLMLFVLHLPIHRAVGNSSAMIVLSSVAGAVSYASHGWHVPNLPAGAFGYVNLLAVIIIAPFAMLGARYGARLAGRIERDKLIRIFAILLIVIGVCMIYPWLSRA